MPKATIWTPERTSSLIHGMQFGGLFNDLGIISEKAKEYHPQGLVGLTDKQICNKMNCCFANGAQSFAAPPRTLGPTLHLDHLPPDQVKFQTARRLKLANGVRDCIGRKAAPMKMDRDHYVFV